MHFSQNDQEILKKKLKLTYIAELFGVSQTYVRLLLIGEREVNSEKSKQIVDYLQTQLQQNA